MRIYLFIAFLGWSSLSSGQTFEKFYKRLDSLHNAADFESCLALETEILTFLPGRLDTLAANANYYLANAYLSLNQHSKAFDYFMRESAVRKAIPSDLTAYSDALYNASYAAFQGGMDRDALTTASMLVNFDRENFGTTSESFINSLLYYIDILTQADRYAEAERELVSAMSAIPKADKRNPLLRSKLAGVYVSTGRYSKAKRLYEEALPALLEAFGTSSPEYHYNLANYGYLLNLQGKFDQAEHRLSEASTAIGQSDWPDHEYTYYAALNNLSLSYQSLGQYDAAENFLRQIIAYDSSVTGTGHPDHAITLSNLGLLLNDKHQYSEAEKVLLEALSILRRNNDTTSTSYGRKLNNLAKVYQSWGKPESSIQLLQQASAIFERQLGRQSPEYATSLHNLGVSYLQKRDNASMKYLDRAKALRAKILGRSHPQYAETIEKIAVYHWQKKNTKAVGATYLDLFNHYYSQIDAFFPALTEEEKSNLYFNRYRPSVDAFASWAISRETVKNQYLGILYDVILNTKGLILYATDKVRRKIQESGDGNLMVLFEQWESQKEQIAYYYSQNFDKKKIDSLLASSQKIEKELARRSAAFAKEIIRPKASWQQVQKTLKTGQAAIEIIRFQQYSSDSVRFTNGVVYAALILTPRSTHGPELVLFSNGKALEERNLNYYRNGIQYKLPDQYSYNNYWEPIAKQLKQSGAKEVFFSPDGAFNSISLNSLVNPATREFLVNEYDIRIMTSTRELLNKQTVKSAAQGYMLFGFPSYAVEQERVESTGVGTKVISRSIRGSLSRFIRGGQGIAALPGTRSEVLEISNLTGGSSQMYLEAEATEQVLKQIKNPKVLHIATHGYFMPDDPAAAVKSPNALLNSGLIMAGASNFIQTGQNPLSDQDDGILTAYEAMNMDLEGTEMVILSACETGLGHQKNGEGVYGLQRAFQIAGTRYLVMSLWSVDDNATRELMTNFYRFWLESGDPQASFRKAQTVILQKYQHPYYWGAFVMMGM